MSETKDALLRVVENLVDHPEEIEIHESTDRGKRTLEVRVVQSDMGAIIGRRGRTAEALRTLLRARTDSHGEKYDLKIREKGGG